MTDEYTPNVVKLSPEDRAKDQAVIDQAKAEFFAKGGKIKELPGFEFGRRFKDLTETEVLEMREEAEEQEKRKRLSFTPQTKRG